MKTFMETPAVQPIEPTPSALRRLRFLITLAGPFIRWALHGTVRKVEIVGREHLSGGPKLVLMNHSNPLDPVLLTAFGRKPIQFLVTEPFMATGFAARLAAWLGQVPKRKLDHDTRSIRILKKWCEVGALVGLFPEGQFSWDGQPLPLQPGLAQLIRFLDVPVVTARLINGDRLQPAWARSARKTSLRLEIDPPRTFGPDEDIESYVRERIHVDPAACARFPVQGKRLAEGLVGFLRFCFECGADHSLRENADRIHCVNCGRGWTVTADNRLSSLDRSLTIAEIWQRARDRLHRIWGPTPNLKSLGPVTVLDATRAQWKSVTEGTLSLRDGSLRVNDWILDVRGIAAHTMDWGDLILLRTDRQRLAIRMPEDSRAIWTLALEKQLEERQNAL